jgi:hypothetical protein
MKPTNLISGRCLLLALLLAVLGLGAAGCASTEPDNLSSRPWNSPEGWQNGSMPMGMTQPH